MSPSIKSPDYRVPLETLLRNFCGTKRKIFLSLRKRFARKKHNNLRNHSQKSFRAKIALFRFCETQVLRNSATRVLRNFVKKLEFNSGKILLWNVFLLVTFTVLTNYTLFTWNYLKGLKYCLVSHFLISILIILVP